MSERLLTVFEVADLFDVDPQTVRVWARQGGLPGAALKVGGQWRFRADVIDRLLTVNYDVVTEN
jgi:excisionase family DNA binding protein